MTVRRLERSPPLDRPVDRSRPGPGWWLGTRAAGLALLALLVPLHRLWHAVPSYPTMSEIWLRLLEAYGL